MTSGINRTAIIVLGMHRSGTSALTGCLKLLGVNLSSDLVPPHAEYNARGHWEYQPAVSLDEEILSALNRTWQDERPFPEGWQNSELVQKLLPKIKSVLSDELISSPLWALKDPRLCCLLPFWLSTLSNCAKPLFVFSLRHPIEVAASLARRDGIPHERSYLIWLRYLLEAELASRSYPRIVVSYDELLSDWRSAMTPFNSRLGLNLPIGTAEISESIDDFLTSALQHHKRDTTIQSSCHGLELADHVYQAFLTHRDNLPPAMFDEFRWRLNELTQSITPWASQIQKLLMQEAKLALQNERLENKLAHVAADRDMWAHEAARVKSTLSWRLTKPWRVLRNMWRWL